MVILNTTIEFPNDQEVIFQMIITELANKIYSFVCIMFTTFVHYVYSFVCTVKYYSKLYSYKMEKYDI